MKTFLISLLILIIAAGVIFYFGLIQLELPENSFAVMFSKTSGYEEETLKPGTFIWKWQKLLPTNTTMHIFSLEKREIPLSVSGELPSSRIYKTVLDGDPDFSYSITYSITAAPNPDTLVNLVKEKHITPDTIDSVYNELANRGEEILTGLLYNSLIQGGYIMDFDDDVKEQITAAFPYLEIFSVTPKEISIPDTDLYQYAKKEYLTLVQTRNTILQQEAVNAAEIEWKSAEKIEALRDFGKLLTEYPVILEYLELGLDKEFLFQSLGLEQEN